MEFSITAMGMMRGSASGAIFRTSRCSANTETMNGIPVGRSVVVTRCSIVRSMMTTAAMPIASEKMSSAVSRVRSLRGARIAVMRCSTVSLVRFFSKLRGWALFDLLGILHVPEPVDDLAGLLQRTGTEGALDRAALEAVESVEGDPGVLGDRVQRD